MRDWCGDSHFDGNPVLRPVRGGGWFLIQSYSHAACRVGLPTPIVDVSLGFRLARLEEPAS